MSARVNDKIVIIRVELTNRHTCWKSVVLDLVKPGVVRDWGGAGAASSCSSGARSSTPGSTESSVSSPLRTGPSEVLWAVRRWVNSPGGMLVGWLAGGRDSPERFAIDNMTDCYHW